MRKSIEVFVVGAVFLTGVSIGGWAQQGAGPELTSWVHVVQASEYQKAPDGSGLLLYTYRDARFNTSDWFDTWIIDWMGKSDGWSRFAPTTDKKSGRMLYDATYHEGYVTWYSYEADLQYVVGQKLKFYRLH